MQNCLAKRIRTISPSQTLAISAKAKALKAAGESVVNFGVGEPDFPTPEYIIAAAEEALKNGRTKYTPSAGIPELRREICEKFWRDNGIEYEPSQIIVSNGAKHSIFNVCYALIDEGDEVIIPAPYWLTYPEVVKTVGGVPVFVQGSKQNHLKITPEQLEAAVTPRTKMLIFNSPCNPTGAVYSEAEVRALAAVCEKHGIFVLSDEIYEKLVYGDVKPFSMAAVSDKMKELTVTVNGVSKTYAMTGWRIGYLAAPKAIAKAIDSFQSHTTSNANSIAQYATLRALTAPQASVDEMVSRFARRREARRGVLRHAGRRGRVRQKVRRSRHQQFDRLCRSTARRRQSGGGPGGALRRGRLRAHLLFAFDGGHAGGPGAHRRLFAEPALKFFGEFLSIPLKYTRKLVTIIIE